MAELTTGVYRLVGLPWFYKAFQELLGARQGRKRLVQLLRPSTGDRILDLGCGSAAILEEMPADVKYVGIDQNSKHIESARKKYGARGYFHAGSFADAGVHAGEQYDLIFALGLLHHLDDAEVNELLQLVYPMLAPNGRFLTIDPVYTSGQSRIAHFLIKNDSGRNVRSESSYLSLSKSVFESVRSVILHDMLRVPYTHCFIEHRK